MKSLMFLILSIGMIVTATAQWSTTHLSETKVQMGACGGDQVFFFAGGNHGADIMLSKVEIYDAGKNTWVYDQLSEPRAFPTGVKLGKELTFFAGGVHFGLAKMSSTVDIYHHSDPGWWTTAKLSIPRLGMSAEAVEFNGRKQVVFAGGANLLTGATYDVVDIYDLNSDTWSEAMLSAPRGGMGSTTFGDGDQSKAIFAGGFDIQTLTVSDRVDIYDISTKTWTTATLSEARGFVAATTVNGLVLIAGGMRNDNTPSDRVDIYNPETGEWTVSSLSVPRAFLENAGTACGKAMFVGGGVLDLNLQAWISSSNVIDIYDASTGNWSVEHLDRSLVNHSVASDGEFLLVGGGLDRGSGEVFDDVTVYKCSGTGIARINKSDLQIFPNPTDGEVNVLFSDTDDLLPAILQVYDMQGKYLVIENMDANPYSLQTQLRPGMYMLHIQTGTRSYAQMVSVQ